MSVLLSITIGKAPNPTAQISGVVKDGVTFLVMDDLVIQPVTSVIEVVKEFNIQENAALKEMVVELGLDEVTMDFHFYIMCVWKFLLWILISV